MKQLLILFGLAISTYSYSQDSILIANLPEQTTVGPTDVWVVEGANTSHITTTNMQTTLGITANTAKVSYDSVYLYSVKLQQMSDSTSVNADSVNIHGDSLRIHIARILALEAADGVLTDTVVEHIARILALEGAGAGSTTMTDFDGTAWRVFYTDGSGDVQEIVLGSDGQVLTSTGASTAPAFEALSGGGDMSFTDTTAMLAPYPDFTEMRGEISDSLTALLDAGEPGVALADSSGVVAGTYVTGWDFVAGQALKSPLASPTFTGTVGAAAITATGSITGAMATTLYTDPTEALSVQDCRNQGHVNNDADALDFTLPAAEAGLVALFLDAAGGVITIDAAAGDIITLDGTALDAGDAIDSPGAVGDFIALWCLDGTNWFSVGRSGTWIDGGTD